MGNKLKKEQVGFVTPVEISLELHKLGLLDGASKDWMIQNVAPYIAREKFFNLDTIGNITFPSYKKCADFVWKWQITAQLAPLVKKIKSQCR